MVIQVWHSKVETNVVLHKIVCISEENFFFKFYVTNARLLCELGTLVEIQQAQLAQFSLLAQSICDNCIQQNSAIFEF
jgi:hypothetical protein